MTNGRPSRPNQQARGVNRESPEGELPCRHLAQLRLVDLRRQIHLCLKGWLQAIRVGFLPEIVHADEPKLVLILSGYSFLVGRQEERGDGLAVGRLDFKPAFGAAWAEGQDVETCTVILLGNPPNLLRQLLLTQIVQGAVPPTALGGLCCASDERRPLRRVLGSGREVGPPDTLAESDRVHPVRLR